MKDKSKILSVFFLSFSILLLLYIVYRAEFFHAEKIMISDLNPHLAGKNISYYFVYYVFSFILIFLSIISFFINKELKLKIIIVLISSAIALYICEGFLTNFEGDLSRKAEIYKKLKKENPNISALIPSDAYLSEINQSIFPFAGSLSNHKIITCNESGYWASYESDRYGFNNTDEDWNKKEIEFLITGDSYAEGQCVNYKDSISGNLKSSINSNAGVLNLGRSNNGPLVEYAVLKEYWPATKVKRVLWLYSEINDFNDLNNELKNSILLKYLQNKNFTQNLKSKQKEIDKIQFEILEAELSQLERSQEREDHIFFRFIKLYNLRMFILNSIFLKPPATILPSEEFKKIIKLANELSISNNSKFYFVYLPDYYRYYKNFKHNNNDYRNYGKVIEILEELNIPIIDLNKELFEKNNDPLSLFPFRKFGHYNELGYKLTAETIFKKIKEFENK